LNELGGNAIAASNHICGMVDEDDLGAHKAFRLSQVPQRPGRSRFSTRPSGTPATVA